VDIEGQRVHRYEPETNTERSWEIGQRVGTVVPRESGGLVIAGDHGMYFLDEATGALTHLVDPEQDVPDNRFNDGKCSPDGRFFAGTISLVKKIGSEKLYRLDPDLTLHEAFGPVTNSNGIAWSADGKTVFYIDTPRKEVLAFDYEEDGRLRNLRSVISTAHLDSSPDGMTIDAEGKLWTAQWGGNCVARWDPQTGQLIGKVNVPAPHVTSVSFGGKHLDMLLITTAKHGMTAEQKSQFPQSGDLFMAKPGVKGVLMEKFGR